MDKALPYRSHWSRKGVSGFVVMVTATTETSAINWRQRCETACEGYSPHSPLEGQRRCYSAPERKVQNDTHSPGLDFQPRSKFFGKLSSGDIVCIIFPPESRMRRDNSHHPPIWILTTSSLWIHSHKTLCVCQPKSLTHRNRNSHIGLTYEYWARLKPFDACFFFATSELLSAQLWTPLAKKKTCFNRFPACSIFVIKQCLTGNTFRNEGRSEVSISMKLRACVELVDGFWRYFQHYASMSAHP